MQENKHNIREIRAYYTDDFVRVYQAYSDHVVKGIELHGTFVQPNFSFSRMTWIKPSFLWMMYRSGWGYKDNRQKNILAIDITHEGFKWCLDNAYLSTKHPKLSQEKFNEYKEVRPVIIQWDPERDIFLNKLDYRAIQIGIKDEAVKKYVNEWIVTITNITDKCATIKELIDNNEIEKAELLLPNERIYPVDKAKYPYLF